MLPQGVGVIVGLMFGTLAILGSFLVLGMALVGIGLIHRRAFGVTALNVDGCFLAFWVGFGFTILLLLAWNFFWPVGLVTQLAVLSLGAAGVVWNWTALSGLAGDTSWRMGKLGALGAVLIAMWVANQSMAGFRSYDGALYHLQGVRWAEAYPVVPGIANLHGPLAFNNSSFLFDATVDSGIWKGAGFHVANGVLVLAVVLQAILCGSRFARAGRKAAAPDVFCFLSLAPLLYLVPLNGGVTSYSTDVPLTLILLVASATMYRILDSDAQSETTPAERAYQVLAVSVLMATAVAIKLSAGVFVAASLAVVLWQSWSRDLGATGYGKRTAIWMLAGVGLFAALWVARGIVMSGYPFFPLSVAGLPVDWRAPAEHADAEMAYLAFTEREFTWSIVSWEWLELAFWDDAYAIALPAGLAAAGMAAYYILRKRERRNLELRRTWWLVIPAAIALAVWLLTAPSTRYCPALFWTVASVALCESLRIVWQSGQPGSRRWMVACLAALGVSPLFVEPLRAAVERGINPITAVARHNLVMPPEDEWFHPVSRHIDVDTFITTSGLELNVPVQVPKAAGLPNACWDAPIPCTPNPAPNLRLRDAGTLNRGFKVDGEWQMRDWPYHWETGFLPEWRRRRSTAAWSH